MRSFLAPFIAFGLLAAANPAQADIMSEQQFRAYLSGVADRLADVWIMDVRPTANAAQGYEGKVGDLELIFSHECRIVPQYDPDSRPPSILIDRENFPALVSYVQQVVLFYILGLPEVRSPEQVDAYVQEILRPFVRSRNELCEKTIPERTKLKEIIPLSFFTSENYNGRNYSEVVADAQSRPMAMRLSEYVAAYPTFFYILHEAGHHVRHRQGTSDRALRERQADEYAVQVFREGGASPTLGIPFLQFLALGSTEQEIQCRIFRVARADTDTAIDLTMNRFPLDYRERIRLLRDFYTDQYATSCEKYDQ